MTDITQKIQALLFVAGEAVPKKDLQELVHVDEAGLMASLQDLKAALIGQGLALIETSEAVQLTTAPAVAEFLGTFLEKQDSQLSRASSETLALIAYRGPISRYDIEAIRGVDSRRILQQLVFRGLVSKQTNQGRVVFYDVTPEFWQHVGLPNRQALPRFEELKDNERLRALLAFTQQ
jgi:segregation and condensation protein B